MKRVFEHICTINSRVPQLVETMLLKIIQRTHNHSPVCRLAAHTDDKKIPMRAVPDMRARMPLARHKTIPACSLIAQQAAPNTNTANRCMQVTHGKHPHNTRALAASLCSQHWPQAIQSTPALDSINPCPPIIQLGGDHATCGSAL